MATILLGLPASQFRSRCSWRTADDSKFVKVTFYGIFVLLILAVIGTQSRGASLALGVAMVYLVMKSRRKALALAAVGVLVAMVLLFAPDAYFDRMSSIKDYETEGSAQGRILAWKTAATMALDHPLTGVGAGHFGVMFGFKYKPADYIGPYLNAHSIYFVMLGEFGFPGILVLLGLIIGNVVRNERVIRNLRSSRAPGDATNLSLMVDNADRIARVCRRWHVSERRVLPAPVRSGRIDAKRPSHRCGRRFGKPRCEREGGDGSQDMRQRASPQWRPTPSITRRRIADARQ